MRLSDLYDVSWRNIQQIAFAWVDRISRKDPGEPGITPRDTVHSVAINFLLVCARFGLDPREVLGVADKVIRRARGVEPAYVRAIEAYLEAELPDG
jgi:hypothetical protein